MRTPIPLAHKKGDVVEFRSGKDMIVGVVTKVARGKTHVRHANGGVSGPAVAFAPTDRKPDFDVTEPKVSDFPAGTVVSFRAKGKGEVVGVVVGAGRTKLAVHTPGGTYDVPAPSLKRSEVEPDFDVAAVIAANEPPKKGDVVDVLAPDGNTLRGIVTKVAKVYATVRTLHSEVDAPFDLITTADATPGADASDAMKDYDVKSYKEHRELSEETEAFSAKITYRGKVVLEASNNGHGGCNMYYPTVKGGPNFHADVKRWAEENGHPNPIEPEDTWIDWHRVGRLIGVPATEVITSYSSPAPGA